MNLVGNCKNNRTVAVIQMTLQIIDHESFVCTHFNLHWSLSDSALCQ